jgi:Ni2+-binding GTPase involved in maturation of urease and hydrogenase
VKAIDTDAKQIIVRADSGVLSTVNISDKTQYKRMAPDAKTLTNASDITLADVGQGDRVWARWRPNSDQTAVPAAQLVVMSKADLAKKQEQERAVRAHEVAIADGARVLSDFAVLRDQGDVAGARALPDQL